MNTARQQQVGRTLFLLLLVVYLSTSDVSAATREDLDELQTIEDVTAETDDKTIEASQQKIDSSEQKPRNLLKKDDEPLGMDSLTIIWYLTTFTALLGFFIVMACTEKSCNRRESKPTETRTCPPTPCPSYKNFAPPSYDTVMKNFKSERVFIVPVHENNNFFTRNPSELQPTTVVDIEKGIEIAVR